MAEAGVEQIATGLRIHRREPLWHATEQFLLFSDIPANKMRKWDADAGMTVFREPSGKSNGLTYDKGGHLIACEHANRRVCANNGRWTGAHNCVSLSG